MWSKSLESRGVKPLRIKGAGFIMWDVVLPTPEDGLIITGLIEGEKGRGNQIKTTQIAEKGIREKTKRSERKRKLRRDMIAKFLKEP